MYNKGKNLIFLISQPRAGSTLTQRMLGSHSQIHTQSEPWILLHPLHALKPENLISGYNSDLYTKGLNDFIDKLPGGKQKYLDSISEVYASFYELILNQKEKQFYLDKTPRYYQIINELYEYYPEAKFIFLWRNPAAVITSIIKTWSKTDWYLLSEFKEDLLNAPAFIIEGIQKLGDKALILLYEDLVENPERNLKKILNYIGLPYETEMINYGNNNQTDKWVFGDKGTIYEKDKPDSSYSDNWQKSLDNPQIWRVINDYIDFLGEKTISEMGYSYIQMINILQKNKPSIDINKHSIALSNLLNNTHTSILENRKFQEIINQKDKLINHTQESLQLKTEFIRKKDEVLIQKDEILKLKGDELKFKDNELKKKEDELKIKDNELKKKEDELRYKDSELIKKDEELKQVKLWIKNVTNSMSFRLGYALLWPIKKILGR